jgi:hypothetical protein
MRPLAPERTIFIVSGATEDEGQSFHSQAFSGTSEEFRVESSELRVKAYHPPSLNP